MISEASEKKGGPYTKDDRHKRRQEVFRLYFEKGYPATKIADMMKVNRHTISSDVQIGYEQLKKTWTKYDLESIGVRQLQRHENQRFQLVEQLELLDNPRDRMIFEKLIFEIDKEIPTLFHKITNTQDMLYYHITKQMNLFSEKNNLGMGFVCMQDMFRVSPETAEKVNKLLDEDTSKLKLGT